MEVSLENYRHNYRVIREFIKEPSNSRVISVIKANAYGMGAVPVAWNLKTAGADFFAVATPDEAIELKEAGIEDPVLVLGSSPYDAADVYVERGIRVTVTDFTMAEACSKAARRQNRPAHIHMKVDSGMGRLGFLPDAALEAAKRISSLPGIDFEGIFTHFSTADSGNLTHTHSQFETFSAIADSIRNAGINVRMTHCCNSGALLFGFSHMYRDAVRPGHILNGILPSSLCPRSIPFKPCFELKTSVGALRELPSGTGISYGLTYITPETERVAVLPIGYADGYSRALSNKGEVLIRGKRCPIRGVVCMDQCIVGVSHLEKVEVGDEVVLIGSQSGETIAVEELAQMLSVPPAAIPVAFTARLPRVYCGCKYSQSGGIHS
jgi:alanine racemase